MISFGTYFFAPDTVLALFLVTQQYVSAIVQLIFPNFGQNIGEPIKTQKTSLFSYDMNTFFLAASLAEPKKSFSIQKTQNIRSNCKNNWKVIDRYYSTAENTLQSEDGLCRELLKMKVLFISLLPLKET